MFRRTISSLLQRSARICLIHSSVGFRNMSQIPKALVFDLDGCVWDPELYQLMGGSPFKSLPNGDVEDSSGEKIYLMGDVRTIMNELKNDAKWSGTVIAIASKCTELKWAEECLEKFKINETQTLMSVFRKDLQEIYWDNKQKHLKKISDTSGIPLKDMIFFDNQMDNCRDVSQLLTLLYICRNCCDFKHQLLSF